MAKKISELGAEEVLKLNNLIGKSDKALEKIIDAYRTEIKGHFESVNDFRKFIQGYPKWHKDNTKFLEVLKLRLQAKKQSNVKTSNPSSAHIENLSIERAIGNVDYLLKKLKEHKYDRFKEGLSSLINELKLLIHGGGEEYTGEEEYEREEPSILKESRKRLESTKEYLKKKILVVGGRINLKKVEGDITPVEKAYCSMLEEEMQTMKENIRKVNKELGLPAEDGIVISGSAEVSMTSSPRDEEAVYQKAVAFVRSVSETSASWLQRDLKIGYNQAVKIIDRMEREGIVGPAEGSSPRRVLIPRK